MSNHIFLSPVSAHAMQTNRQKLREYETSADEECTHEMSYEFNHALMLLIQKTTNQATHVIMNTMIAEVTKMMTELGIDPNNKKAGATYQKWGSTNHWWPGDKRRNRVWTYPGTDIICNLIITIRWENYDVRAYYDNNNKLVHEKCEPNCNKVRVKVNIPNKIIKFSTGDMSMLLAEGDILDMSSDIEEVNLKSSPTLEQKKRKRKAKTT